MKKYIHIAFLLAISCTHLSCQDEFLEIKPDKALLVPTTLTDMQALLDNYNVMINTAPYMGIIGSDDIYTTDAGWEGATPIIKAAYLWEKEIYKGEAVSDWNNCYQQIFYANIVLEGIQQINPSAANLKDWQSVKGSALFYRAFAYYGLLAAICKTLSGLLSQPGPWCAHSQEFRCG